MPRAKNAVAAARADNAVPDTSKVVLPRTSDAVAVDSDVSSIEVAGIEMDTDETSNMQLCVRLEMSTRSYGTSYDHDQNELTL